MGHLGQNFRCRRFHVRATIVDIVKLIAPNTTGDLRGQTSRQFNIIVGMPVRLGIDFNECGTGLTQCIFFLLRLRAGNDNNGFVTLGGCHVRQANARVSRCAFDNGTTRLEFAIAFEALYNEFGGAVFLIMHDAWWWW